MELNDFISQSLIQIMDGVIEAQRHAKEIGARVNPINTHLADNMKTYKMTRGIPTAGQQIDFDIAVTIASGGELEGSIDGEIKGTLVVVGADLAGNASTSQFDTSSVISRVRFSVPVFLPEQHN